MRSELEGACRVRPELGAQGRLAPGTLPEPDGRGSERPRPGASERGPARVLSACVGGGGRLPATPRPECHVEKGVGGTVSAEGDPGSLPPKTPLAPRQPLWFVRQGVRKWQTNRTWERSPASIRPS